MKINELDEKYKALEKKFKSEEINELEYKKEKEQLVREISHLEYEADKKEQKKITYLVGFFLITSFGVTFAVYNLAVHGEINVVSDNFSAIKGESWKIENTSYITGSGIYDWRLHVSEKKFYNGTIKFVYRVRWEELAPLTHDVLLTSGDWASDELVYYKHQVSKIPYFGGRTACLSLSTKGVELYQKGEFKGEFYHIHAIPASPEIYSALQSLGKGDEVEIEGYYSEGITTVYKETGGEYFGNGDCHELLVTKIKRSGYSINIL